MCGKLKVRLQCSTWHSHSCDDACGAEMVVVLGFAMNVETGNNGTGGECGATAVCCLVQGVVVPFTGELHDRVVFMQLFW